MQTLGQIKEMLEEAGLSPRKSLGQNFLIDQNLIVRLVEAGLAVNAAPSAESNHEAAGPARNDTHGEHEASRVGSESGSERRPTLVLEVGPGTGTMTEELLARGCRVVAVELDHGLCELLSQRHGSDPNFTLVEGDCLSGKSTLSDDVVAALGGRPFGLVSNLPYGAGTGVLLALLTRHPECGRMAVTVQREVADRLAAAPGTEAYGSISIVAQCIASVRKIATLPPECFWPRPEVTSAMVVLERLAEPLTDNPVSLADFCKRAFAGRRKQLRGLLNSMGWGEGVSPAPELPEGVRPESRVEELSPIQVSALERAGRAR